MASEKRKLRKRTVVSYKVPEIDDDDYGDESPDIQERDDALDDRATSRDDSRDSDKNSDGFEDSSDESSDSGNDSNGSDDGIDGSDDGIDGSDDGIDGSDDGSDDGIDGSQEDLNSQGHGQDSSGGESSTHQEAKPKSIGDDGEEGDQAMISRKIKIAISSLTRRANKTFNMNVFDTMKAEADQLISERSSIDRCWESFGLEVSQHTPRTFTYVLTLAGLPRLERHPRRPHRTHIPKRGYQEGR